MGRKIIFKRIVLYVCFVLLFFFIFGYLISKLDANIQESIQISNEERTRTDSDKVVAMTKDGTKVTLGKNGLYKVYYEDGGYVLLKDMMNYTIVYPGGSKVIKTNGQYELLSSNGNEVLILKDGSYVVKEDGKKTAIVNLEGNIELMNGEVHPMKPQEYLAAYLRDNQLNTTKHYDSIIEDLRVFIRNQ